MNQIILGDCFENLSKIKSKSIDLILTDPPYNISKVSNFNRWDSKFGTISYEFGDWDTNIDFDILFSEYKRVLKPGSALIIFYDIWKCDILKELGEKYKFRQPRVCQWVKNNPTPVNSKFNYLSNSIEFFFSFTKGKNATFNSSYDKGIYNYPICHGKERSEHPTQKPIELFKSIIKKHSNEGDIILDTFGGSGTTAVAAIETNRNYILMEKDEKYHQISETRIKQTIDKSIKIKNIVI